jgi:hypothetical protein
MVIFKYSDDKMTSLYYLTRGNSSIEINNYKLEFSNFLMTLLIQSIKMKNYLLSNKFLEIIENNIIKENSGLLNSDYFINFYTAAAIVKKSSNDLESSSENLNKTLNFIYNSNQLVLTTESTQIKLVNFHVNLAILKMLQNSQNGVIENLENTVKILKNNPEIITNSEKFRILATIHLLLANFYSSANEKIKATIQLTAVNELIKKFNKIDESLRLISNYAEELNKDINK